MSLSTGPGGIGRARAMRPSGGTPEIARAGSDLAGSPGAGARSGSGKRSLVRVSPIPVAAVTIALRADSPACGEDKSVCTTDHRALSGVEALTIRGPARCRWPTRAWPMGRERRSSSR